MDSTYLKEKKTSNVKALKVLPDRGGPPILSTITISPLRGRVGGPLRRLLLAGGTLKRRSASFPCRGKGGPPTRGPLRSALWAPPISAPLKGRSAGTLRGKDASKVSKLCDKDSSQRLFLLTSFVVNPETTRGAPFVPSKVYNFCSFCSSLTKGANKSVAFIPPLGGDSLTKGAHKSVAFIPPYGGEFLFFIAKVCSLGHKKTNKVYKSPSSLRGLEGIKYLQPNKFFISCKQSRIENNTTFYGCFYLGPFETGQSVTIANALRRTLLSDLAGIAITSVEIEGATHEYESLVGVREPVLDILLNLKEIILKKVLPERSFISQCKPNKYTKTLRSQIGYLRTRGPGVVKASDLKLPSFIKCVDPEQYIATLSEDGYLNMKFYINEGKNYVMKSITKNMNLKGAATLERKKRFMRGAPLGGGGPFRRRRSHIRRSRSFSPPVWVPPVLARSASLKGSIISPTEGGGDTPKGVISSGDKGPVLALPFRGSASLKGSIISYGDKGPVRQEPAGSMRFAQGPGGPRQGLNGNILYLDAVFMPVTKVNYIIEANEQSNDGWIPANENLILPKEALWARPGKASSKVSGGEPMVSLYTVEGGTTKPLYTLPHRRWSKVSKGDLISLRGAGLFRRGRPKEKDKAREAITALSKTQTGSYALSLFSKTPKGFEGEGEWTEKCAHPYYPPKANNTGLPFGGEGPPFGGEGTKKAQHLRAFPTKGVKGEHALSWRTKKRAYIWTGKSFLSKKKSGETQTGPIGTGPVVSKVRKSPMEIMLPLREALPLKGSARTGLDIKSNFLGVPYKRFAFKGLLGVGTYTFEQRKEPYLKTTFKIPSEQQPNKNLKHNIMLEIWTNGSIHPRQALYDSFKKVLSIFSKLQKIKIVGSMLKSEKFYKKLITQKLFVSGGAPRPSKLINKAYNMALGNFYTVGGEGLLLRGARAKQGGIMGEAHKATLGKKVRSFISSPPTVGISPQRGIIGDYPLRGISPTFGGGDNAPDRGGPDRVKHLKYKKPLSRLLLQVKARKKVHFLHKKLKNQTFSFCCKPRNSLFPRRGKEGAPFKHHLKEVPLLKEKINQSKRSKTLDLIDVGSLNISLRPYTCLKRANIHTVKDLLNCSKQALLEINNFGVRSLEEVEQSLNEIGLSLD